MPVSPTPSVAWRENKFTIDEVAARAADGSLWMVIKDVVYDLTGFRHPGGVAILKKWRGKDATKPFMSYHKWVSLEMVSGMERGMLRTEAPVLKGGATDARVRREQALPPRKSSDPDVRAALDAMGVGDIALALSDLQLHELAVKEHAAVSAAAAAGPEDGEEETDEAIDEVFESLADPHSQTVSPAALTAFLSNLGEDGSTIAGMVPAHPLTRQQFVELVESLS